MKAQKKSCIVSRNVLGSCVTKETVAQGMKQREDSVFKLCSSHDCAGLRPKVKAGPGPKYSFFKYLLWLQCTEDTLRCFRHCWTVSAKRPL